MPTIARSFRRGAKLLDCLASIGDSMTWRPSFPESYPTLIGAARNFTVVQNAGMDGHRSTQMAARFDKDILSWRAGAISIMCGTNDAAFPTPIGDFEAAVRGMVNKGVASGARVTLCTPPVVRADARPMQTYNNVLRAIAADTPGVVLFEVYNWSAALPSGTLDAYFEVDNTHWKLVGNQAIRDLANQPANASAFRNNV